MPDGVAQWRLIVKNGDQIMNKITMTVPEAAKCLGISRNTAYSMAQKGELPVLKLGQKRIVVPIAVLEKFIQQAEGNIVTRD